MKTNTYQRLGFKDDKLEMLLELDNAFLKTFAALTRSLINPENKDIPLFEKDEANIVPNLHKLSDIIIKLYNLYTSSGHLKEVSMDLFNEAFNLIANIHALQATDTDAWIDLETYIGIMCDYLEKEIND